MNKTFTFAMISLMAIGAFAQDGENLVPNGSFESIDGKGPKKLGGIEMATGWESPTGAKADLFTFNKKVPDISVPKNIYGEENAREGENYVGIVAYSYNNKLSRSYILTKLNTPLKKGERYCVRYNVSLAESSTYASNDLGVMLTKKPYSTEDKGFIAEAKPSVLPEGNAIVSGTYNWEKICNTYVAEGGEKFITIGNFQPDNNATKNIKRKKGTNGTFAPILAAYYYIDDVVLYLVDEEHPCDCASADPTAGFSKIIYSKTVKVTDEMPTEKKIELQQVYFAFGKADISGAGEEALTLIVKEMNAHPELKIQVKGFADEAEEVAAEKVAQFQAIDNQRINAVFKFLTENGIAESRLISSPQGSSVKSSDIFETDEDDIKQAKNRRIEFKVRK